MTFRRTSSSPRLVRRVRHVLSRRAARKRRRPGRRSTWPAICSVVPDAVHSLRNCFRKYFRFEPFLLQPGVKTGLKIRYRNPLEVGADKIANAIGALARFPGRNLLIVDFGTATTLCAVTKDKEYLGGIITPGIHTSMAALESNTARLPAVEIVRPAEVLGRSTVESIQSGLYYGTLATVRSLAALVTEATLRRRKAGGCRHRRLRTPVRGGASVRRVRARAAIDRVAPRGRSLDYNDRVSWPSWRCWRCKAPLPPISASASSARILRTSRRSPRC